MKKKQLSKRYGEKKHKVPYWKSAVGSRTAERIDKKYFRRYGDIK